jgi:putative addiction module CopG family antidote
MSALFRPARISERFKPPLSGLPSAPLRFTLTLPSCKLYPNVVEVHLTPAQEAFIRQVIDTGRFQREEDVVQEALSLLEERERKPAEFLLTLDDAKASLARGEGRIITHQSMRELSDEVKQRGLARLAAEQPTPR